MRTPSACPPGAAPPAPQVDHHSLFAALYLLGSPVSDVVYYWVQPLQVRVGEGGKGGLGMGRLQNGRRIEWPGGSARPLNDSACAAPARPQGYLMTLAGWLIDCLTVLRDQVTQAITALPKASAAAT